MSKSIGTKEYSNFVKKLKEARLNTGLRQIDVSKKLKRHQSYISKIESGEQRVDVTELNKLAKIYKKDINYFIK